MKRSSWMITLFALSFAAQAEQPQNEDYQISYTCEEQKVEGLSDSAKNEKLPSCSGGGNTQNERVCCTRNNKVRITFNQ